MIKFLGLILILATLSSCATKKVIVKNCVDYEDGYKSCELVKEQE